MKDDYPRLIEHAFPLKQASLDSVHEKNVRHGHISTLHIWPARRPLAACRAALAATLLPDPSAAPKPEGMTEEQWRQECAKRRQELCEKIGGKVVNKIERTRASNGSMVEREKEETEGGILHWGRETENEATLDWLRDKIRNVYDGRPPKVLDPFAGGGAIPLEAMRLGCETTAMDINPVAWFILKCTLEYPQKLAGQKQPLPDFVLEDEDFMEDYFKKVYGLKGARLKREMEKLGHAMNDPQQELDLALGDDGISVNADLAWHVRAWGKWVLNEALIELAEYYPTYAEFETLDKQYGKAYEPQPLKLVPLNDDGTPDAEALNSEFSEEYLKDKRNPRWVVKPTVAYLWARTVECKNCRASVPLLKTRWLCKKSNKRVLLTMEPAADKAGVEFGVQSDVPVRGGNAVQRRQYDQEIGAGTMSRSGVKCPCCGTIMTMADIRVEGKAGRLGMVATAVVTESPKDKEYRLPTEHEIDCAGRAEANLERVFSDIPFGLPTETITEDAKRNTWCVQYGVDQFHKLFSARQLLMLGTLVKKIRKVATWDDCGLPKNWREAVVAFLSLLFDKTADYNSSVCTWHNSGEKMRNTFARFAIPMAWDTTESATLNEVGGSFTAQLEWISRYLDNTLANVDSMPEPSIKQQSATQEQTKSYDAIVTDPPYYDAIGYSVCMDFFYVWIKRIVHGTLLDRGSVFASDVSPKWDSEADDGELIDDASRHDGDAMKSKASYENGMARSFVACEKSLSPEGRLVIVFAHKHPDAWETLVSAIIRAGFIVDGSWPIKTEMGTRQRAMNSAALASSVWLVCRKRNATSRPGWDEKVVGEMRSNITGRLREFWDAGIRGPDFVWAATGPALEAYSKYPAVRRAAPREGQGPTMTVHEFLVEVRKMVVDFVVGEVLSEVAGESAIDAADRLDEVTSYYLLHRHDFGMAEAPVGTCILYAVSCGLSDSELAGTWDVLDSGKGIGSNASDDGSSSTSGSNVKLKTWKQRKRKSMGFEAPGGRPIPLIDRVHRLMHLWKEGDVNKVDDYLDDNALRRSELFKRLLQSLIELSDAGSDERALLESLSNHVSAKGARDDRQAKLL